MCNCVCPLQEKWIFIAAVAATAVESTATAVYVGCHFDYRIAFPCTSTDIVPCVIYLLLGVDLLVPNQMFLLMLQFGRSLGEEMGLGRSEAGQNLVNKQYLSHEETTK